MTAHVTAANAIVRVVKIALGVTACRKYVDVVRIVTVLIAIAGVDAWQQYVSGITAAVAVVVIRKYQYPLKVVPHPNVLRRVHIL